jgi:hypothetical protein
MVNIQYHTPHPNLLPLMGGVQVGGLGVWPPHQHVASAVTWTPPLVTAYHLPPSELTDRPPPNTACTPADICLQLTFLHACPSPAITFPPLTSRHVSPTDIPCCLHYVVMSSLKNHTPLPPPYFHLPHHPCAFTPHPSCTGAHTFPVITLPIASFHMATNHSFLCFILR